MYYYVFLSILLQLEKRFCVFRRKFDLTDCPLNIRFCFQSMIFEPLLPSTPGRCNINFITCATSRTSTSLIKTKRSRESAAVTIARRTRSHHYMYTNALISFTIIIGLCRIISCWLDSEAISKRQSFTGAIFKVSRT